ncbi:hypothetical protein HG536_0G00550 [Torulaspora globosa]|uniref:PH-response regulator protein palI/RIM9 n=1 Tax=Torulaspora globosa TaxID=48254 RepID=A0A7G3ZL12_9SACH|nr:uncharacterized protein HG536_0G00550 [Torulaspora globosa]QLL34198.1 hypothetical protein HG536_0G00550 [Torulaspora globosa]
MRVIITVVVLTTVSLVFQLLPVISVPITKSLALSNFLDSAYGVFGWCNTNVDLNGTVCTPAGIGYTDLSVDMSGRKTFLPSMVKYPVTKLLVVHPLSLAFTSILWVMILLLLSPSLRSSSGYLLVVALFSLPTVLFSLLCFLVDILIFISHLNWPGWLMLAATISLAICCSLLWTLRRSVSIKNYETLQAKERASSVETYATAQIAPIKTGSITVHESSVLEPGLS